MKPLLSLLLLAVGALATPVLAAHVGPLDTTFGDGGMRSYGFQPVNGQADDMAFAGCPGANGTLVVVGTASYGQRIVTTRLLSDGDYDTSFSGDGKESFDLAGYYEPRFVPAACPSTGIVFARHTQDATGEQDLQIVRVLKDTGLPNPTFANNGVLTLDLDNYIHVTTLGQRELPLGVNVLADGKIVVTGECGYPFAALISATGAVENVAIYFQDLGYFTTAIDAPNGSLWLYGEGAANSLTRIQIDRTTLQQNGPRLSIAPPANTLYWAGSARAIDADTVAMAVVQGPSSTDYQGEPRLAIFRGSEIAVLTLPSAQLDGSAMLLSTNPRGHQGVTVLPGRRVLFGATTIPILGEHFAMAYVGRQASEDHVENAFGSNGAQTAALRPAASGCTGSPPTQRYSRATLWNGRPVFVGHAGLNCASPGNLDDYLVGRIETNYLFADGFD